MQAHRIDIEAFSLQPERFVIGRSLRRKRFSDNVTRQTPQFHDGSLKTKLQGSEPFLVTMFCTIEFVLFYRFVPE